MDVMIDLETLDVTPGCVILTIGAVKFDPHGTGHTEEYDVRPSVDDQCALGRIVNDDTIAWWSRQNAAAKEEAFTEQGRISFNDAILGLQKFCWNQRAVWAHGSCFDIVIVENAMRQLGINVPWNFWSVRDTRTLFEVANVRTADDGLATSHRAVDDAARQALTVQRAYQRLKLVDHRVNLA